MPTPPKSGLPLGFRLGVLTVLAGLLVFNLIWDATHADYDGVATTLMLGSIVGGAVGYDQLLGARKSGSDDDRDR